MSPVPSHFSADWQLHINPMMTPAAKSAPAVSYAFDAAQFMAQAVYQYPGVDGNWLAWWLTIPAGTWTLVVLTRTSTQRGMFDVEISTDGTTWTAIATGLDAYSSPAAQKRHAVTGIVIPTSAAYLVRVKTNGKNASSAGYELEYNWLTLMRTA